VFVSGVVERGIVRDYCERILSREVATTKSARRVTQDKFCRITIVYLYNGTYVQKHMVLLNG